MVRCCCRVARQAACSWQEMSPPTIHRNDLCRVEFVIIDLVLTYEPDYHDIFASVNLPDELFLLCLPPVVNLPNLKILISPFRVSFGWQSHMRISQYTATATIGIFQDYNPMASLLVRNQCFNCQRTMGYFGRIEIKHIRKILYYRDSGG